MMRRRHGAGQVGTPLIRCLLAGTSGNTTINTGRQARKIDISSLTIQRPCATTIHQRESRDAGRQAGTRNAPLCPMITPITMTIKMRKKELVVKGHAGVGGAASHCGLRRAPVMLEPLPAQDEDAAR